MAVDHIINICKKLKYDKRVYLITDGESPLNRNGIEQIVETTVENGVQLSIM